MEEALKESRLADPEYWMIPVTQQEQKNSASFSSHFPPPSTKTCLNKQKIHKGITWYAQGRQVRRKTWPGICIPSTEAAHTTAHPPPPASWVCVCWKMQRHEGGESWDPQDYNQEFKCCSPAFPLLPQRRRIQIVKSSEVLSICLCSN